MGSNDFIENEYYSGHFTYSPNTNKAVCTTLVALSTLKSSKMQRKKKWSQTDRQCSVILSCFTSTNKKNYFDLRCRLSYCII